MNAEQIHQIQRYIGAGCPAQTESLLADAHIFWWSTCGAEDADFVIINRDGNLARAFQTDGVWKIAKNLGRAGQCLTPESWEWLSMSGPCLRELAQKMWLPSRTEERLTFLPKELTPPGSRRQMICRDQLFKLFGRPGNAFVLELAGAQSPEFQGKPWESEAAVAWCVGRCHAPDAPKGAEAVVAAMQMQQASHVAADQLAELWGRF